MTDHGQLVHKKHFSCKTPPCSEAGSQCKSSRSGYPGWQYLFRLAPGAHARNSGPDRARHANINGQCIWKKPGFLPALISGRPLALSESVPFVCPSRSEGNADLTGADLALVLVELIPTLCRSFSGRLLEDSLDQILGQLQALPKGCAAPLIAKFAEVNNGMTDKVEAARRSDALRAMIAEYPDASAQAHGFANLTF